MITSNNPTEIDLVYNSPLYRAKSLFFISLLRDDIGCLYEDTVNDGTVDVFFHGASGQRSNAYLTWYEQLKAYNDIIQSGFVGIIGARCKTGEIIYFGQRNRSDQVNAVMAKIYRYLYNKMPRKMSSPRLGSQPSPVS